MGTVRSRRGCETARNPFEGREMSSADATGQSDRPRSRRRWNRQIGVTLVRSCSQSRVTGASETTTTATATATTTTRASADNETCVGRFQLSRFLILHNGSSPLIFLSLSSSPFGSRNEANPTGIANWTFRRCRHHHHRRRRHRARHIQPRFKSQIRLLNKIA